MDRDRRGRHPTITLIHDPNGFYFRGATFSSYEFAYSTLIGSWLDGMRFYVYREREEDFEAIIIGGVPVSLVDGKHLEARYSGTYGWKEGAYEWTNGQVTTR